MVVVTRRGKSEVSLEAIQKNLPLNSLPERRIKEFYALVDRLEPEEVDLLILVVRGILESRLEGSNVRK